ncbi:hypothetical protein L345_08138, partial [Ophiophagus hannah]
MELELTVAWRLAQNGTRTHCRLVIGPKSPSWLSCLRWDWNSQSPTVIINVSQLLRSRDCGDAARVVGVKHGHTSPFFMAHEMTSLLPLLYRCDRLTYYHCGDVHGRFYHQEVQTAHRSHGEVCLYHLSDSLPVKPVLFWCQLPSASSGWFDQEEAVNACFKAGVVQWLDSNFTRLKVDSDFHPSEQFSLLEWDVLAIISLQEDQGLCVNGLAFIVTSSPQCPKAYGEESSKGHDLCMGRERAEISRDRRHAEE